MVENQFKSVMKIAILRVYPQIRAGETLFDGQSIKGSSQLSATACYELKKLRIFIYRSMLTGLS